MALVLFRYPSEKLSTASRALMAPYPPGGEAEAFLYAFSECDHGLRDVHADDLDDSARSMVSDDSRDDGHNRNRRSIRPWNVPNQS
jgi:hypothetical protein